MRNNFDYNTIENIIEYHVQLKEDPKERKEKEEREYYDALADKALNNLTAVEDIEIKGVDETGEQVKLTSADLSKFTF